MDAAFKSAVDRASLGRTMSGAACIAAIAWTTLLHRIAIVAPATAFIVVMVISNSADRICRNIT